MQVFRSDDVFQLFGDIENGEHLLYERVTEHNPRFGTGFMLAFDSQEKYVGIASSQHVCVFSLQDHNFG